MTTERAARPSGLGGGPGLDVASEASFDVLFAALPSPAWLVDDRRGDVLAANPAAAGRTAFAESAAVRHVNWHGRAARLILEAPVPPGASEREVRRLLGAIEAGGLGVFRTDLSGRITGWDGSAEALFGWTAAEILGRPATLLAPDDLVRQVGRVLRAVGAGRELRELETRGRTRTGRTLEIALSVAPTRDEAGRIDGAAALARDITRHKQLEVQLRQAQKMEAIGRLAGGIAHDFNNLLTAIHGYAQLLMEALPEDDDRRSDAEAVVRAATRAGALTGQLLAFSRHQVMNPSIVAVNAVVEGVASMLDRLLGDHITLVLGLDSSAGVVRADAGQLEQVILNLAINGRDAMPGGGDLLIETASVELDEAYAEAHSEIRPGRYVLLAVSDRGTGLSEEARQHLFEPFYTTKPAGRGTGLGLATVYGIVRQSGGHIVVFSEQEIGTTFRVYLPQVGPPSAPVATKPAAASVRPAPRPKPRTGATILVAEDDPSVRALLESVLAGRGHRVLAAPHGAAALLLASRHTGPVDLLVSDIMMPGMTGPQLVGELLRGRPDVPVLFVSGFSDAETVDRARVGRRSAFLPKPFAPDALIQRVDELLGATHGGSR